MQHFSYINFKHSTPVGAHLFHSAVGSLFLLHLKILYVRSSEFRKLKNVDGLEEFFLGNRALGL